MLSYYHPSLGAKSVIRVSFVDTPIFAGDLSDPLKVPRSWDSWTLLLTLRSLQII